MIVDTSLLQSHSLGLAGLKGQSSSSSSSAASLMPTGEGVPSMASVMGHRPDIDAKMDRKKRERGFGVKYVDPGRSRAAPLGGGDGYDEEGGAYGAEQDDTPMVVRYGAAPGYDQLLAEPPAMSRLRALPAAATGGGSSAVRLLTGSHKEDAMLSKAREMQRKPQFGDRGLADVMPTRAELDELLRS